MTLLNYELVKESDWVSGATQLDEKFIGFVQTMNDDGVLKVWVTQSDREEIVGTSTIAKLSKVKRLPDNSHTSPDEVRGLIELALVTHDKEWFELLSAKLASSSSGPSQVSGTFTLTQLKERF
jgi:hypothetical protein